MKEKFYLTTAIAYTSAKPHIGNTYEIILSDAIARYKRLQGYDVTFQTGTDEHGEKIQLKAEAADIKEQEYVDNIAGEVKNVYDKMNTSYDRFVRTTDKEHEAKVQRIFRKLYDKGDIYKSEYKGMYCVPCESFFTDSQLVDGKCPDCGREVELKNEEAYFFKLSKYQKQLEEYLDSHPDFIEPISRKNEMVNNFLKPGLQDLCVTRTSFNWGIPVDFDPKHVVYVWLDALTNYITFAGYDVDGSTDEFNKVWPADLQIVGKDIIRFHTLYWPIFLMALDLPLPKKIFGHPWLLMGNDKMSKSKGNVLYADELSDEFGVDAVRYYLLHEMPYANDGNLTKELLIERTNSDLANILGNLVQRTISMCNKYFEGYIVNKNTKEDLDEEFINLINDLKSKVDKSMNNIQVAEGLTNIFAVLKASNKYIDDTMPWALAKDETKLDRLMTVLYNLLESIRVCSNFLDAFLPDTGKNIKKQINNFKTELNYLDSNEFTVGTPTPLFKRIDVEK